MPTYSTRTDRRRAIVIGGSAAGLCTAALLRKAGWQADVYERSDVELVGRGAGIVCHAELLRALDASGAGTAELGVAVTERIAFGDDGRVVARRAFPQLLTSWDRLHSLLRRVVPDENHHLAHELSEVTQDEAGVTAHFRNGAAVTGDLLVGADGIRSAVRPNVAPATEPAYSGYIIWRGLAEEAAIPADLRATIFERFTFHFPPENEILGYPIAGLDNDLRPGHRRYNWVWYRKLAARELARLLTDSSGRHHAFGMPPALVPDAVIEAMRRDAETTIAPPLLEVLRRIPRLFFTPIYDLASPCYVQGRIALVGDAAVVARPHVGFGTTKAAGDALALAAALAAAGGDVITALADYDATRRPIGLRCYRRAQLLGTWLSGERPNDPSEHAEWEAIHSIEGVLRHVASDEFLNGQAAA